ncbi:TPA: hypothetical protein ACQTX0_005812 [Pseudomonas aeruginosa]
MNDYKSAFNAAAADISAIIALLGFTKYPGVDPVLRAIADLILEKAENQVLREERDAANKRADTLEHRMMGMMTRHFAEAWRNRDTQKALDGYLSAGIAQLEQERDAAQARVAELTATRNRYGLDAHYFNKNLQRILRDFESFTPDELARSLIILAKVADEKVVAQAQHSVPEGWKLVPVEPTPEMLDARRDCEDGMDGYLVEDTEYYFPDRGAVRAFLARVYQGLIAAAPAPGGER